MKIEREEIVVGSSLAAVLYAFINELPLFYSVPYRPFRFDYFSPDVDLSSVKLDPVRRELKSFGADKIVGIAKNDLWERLLFLMSDQEQLSARQNITLFQVRHSQNMHQTAR